MAAASGFASTSSFRCRISSSSMASPSRNQFFLLKPSRMNKMDCSQKCVSLNPRCVGGGSGDFVRENEGGAMSSSLSALQSLKFSSSDRYTKEKSSIVVIGLNVHTSPVEMREKLAIREEQWPQAIEELCALNHIAEAAVLSTCNRIEIYVVALSQNRGVKEVTEWMSKTSGVPVSEISEHRFLLYNKDAIQHLFKVSSGLDSLVLGEGQILAQVKQVVKIGQGVTGFGRKISGLFKHAITVGKRVRTDTNIGAGAVSVSAAAVELGLMKLPEPSYIGSKVLVVGAGKMGKLVIKHLVSKGCKQMVVVNRTEDRVASLQKEFKDVEIIYKPLPDLVSCITEADVIFTSTASNTPLLLKKDIENLPSKFNQPRLFIDISVPRNVSSCVSDLETARVFNVDDLKEVVDSNKEDRQRKAMEAQTIIFEEVKKCESIMDSLETVPTIKKLRAYTEKIRASELEKCLSKMGDDISKKQKDAVYGLSIGIMNKLLHGPMEHLRCDGAENRTLSEILENMHALNRIFELETETSVLEEKMRAKIGKQS